MSLTRRVQIVLGLVGVLVATLLAAPAQAQVVCEGYGSTSSTIYTSESQVNSDMADDNRVEDVTIDINNFSNDMVNVPSGERVTFARVTFAGNGEGHLLEVKNNSSVRVYRSAFVGHAEEDDIQFQQHEWSVIGDPNDSDSGNCFNSQSEEDHIDIKESTNTSRNIGINHNVFEGSQWCVLANNGPKTVHFRWNECDGGAYFRGGVFNGRIGGNTFNNVLWIDDVEDYIIEDNTFNDTVRYGAGTVPQNNWFRNDVFGSVSNWDYRNGSCFRYNNDIRLDECSYKAP